MTASGTFAGLATRKGFFAMDDLRFNALPSLNAADRNEHANIVRGTVMVRGSYASARILSLPWFDMRPREDPAARLCRRFHIEVQPLDRHLPTLVIRDPPALAKQVISV